METETNTPVAIDYSALPLPLDIEDFRLPEGEPGDDGAALQRLISELARRESDT